MNVRQQIEAQRKVLDQMVGTADNLTELLQEAQKMDQLIEAYEEEHTKTISYGEKKTGLSATAGSPVFFCRFLKNFLRWHLHFA